MIVHTKIESSASNNLSEKHHQFKLWLKTAWALFSKNNSGTLLKGNYCIVHNDKIQNQVQDDNHYTVQWQTLGKGNSKGYLSQTKLWNCIFPRNYWTFHFTKTD